MAAEVYGLGKHSGHPASTSCHRQSRSASRLRVWCRNATVECTGSATPQMQRRGVHTNDRVVNTTSRVKLLLLSWLPLVCHAQHPGADLHWLQRHHHVCAVGTGMASIELWLGARVGAGVLAGSNRRCRLGQRRDGAMSGMSGRRGHRYGIIFSTTQTND